MNDSGSPPTSVLPSTPAGPPVAPAPVRRASFLGRCAWAFRFLLRRPGRTAVVVVLAGLIAAGAWMAGVQAWAYSELQAARFAVEHYHNRQARLHLNACLKVWPHDPTALLLAARTARRIGDFGEAERFLDGYEEVRGKDDEDLILERVLLQAHRGRVDSVADFCAVRVRDNHPSAPLILEAQAAGLMRDYRIEEAGERLQAWLKLRPDDCQALLMEGILEDLQNRTNDAIDKYQRVVELDPDNEDAGLRLTGQLLLARKPMEALPHLERLRKALPDDPRVLTRIAQCRIDFGQAEEAKKILDGVLAQYPHFPEALDERGFLALNNGDPAGAEAWLRDAVAHDPADQEARYHLFQCLTAQGKGREADEQKARLDEMEADLQELYGLIGGKMQQAPYDPALRTRAGEIALRAGAAEDGLRWLESALEIDPHYAPAHQALARYYQAIGDRGLAARHEAQAGP